MFSHSQTVVVCSNCSSILCSPTGGRARLTEGAVPVLVLLKYAHLHSLFSSQLVFTCGSLHRLLVSAEGRLKGHWPFCLPLTQCTCLMRAALDPYPKERNCQPAEAAELPESKAQPGQRSPILAPQPAGIVAQQQIQLPEPFQPRSVVLVLLKGACRMLKSRMRHVHVLLGLQV